MNKISDSEEFEHCILCGKLTCIPISMPVDWRENYVIGCGQICAECAKKEQQLTARGKVLSDEKILLALEQSRKDSEK